MNRNIDPRTKYELPPMPFQEQSEQPGLTSEMEPKPDHGEESYVGAGRLLGQHALITGGDSGIGRAVAIAFAREGADVALVYLPEEEEDAQDTKDIVEEAGANCLLLPADLRREEDCVEAVRHTIEKLGSLEILVLNAGVQREREPGAEIERAEIMRVFETNLVAPLLLMREAADHLKPGASVIVTASIQSFQPAAHLLDYAMTKSALVAFTEALAAEQTERGVRVNAVAPGPVWTPLIPATGWGDKLVHFGENTPMGRPAQPAELAGAYVYLASEEASYVSGAVIPVTGGRSV